MNASGNRVMGTWIGVDVGTVRVGVAKGDREGILATPLVTLRRDPIADTDLTELAALVLEYGAVGVVVGLPRTLAGADGPSAMMARGYAAALEPRVAPVPVTLYDERLSTTTAQRRLAQAGRSTRKSRGVIDQAAAVVILQDWLDGPARRAMQ